MYDVLVIGGGVTGCSIARELSRYRLKTAVAEREEDVCSGTSKANSGIVHAGFDAEPGSQKARMNVRGNRMMPQLARELDFAFRQNGSLVLCFDRKQLGQLQALKEKGEANGVEGLKLLNGEEARALEPKLSGAVEGALYAPTGGIVCPFGLTIAMAENAAVNGVEFLFETEVLEIRRIDAGYLVRTNTGEIEARAVVNAAGVYADALNNMVSERKYHITARRGQYCLLDKKAGTAADRTIFQMPTAMGKGVLVTPTVHGNLMLGPTAEDIPDKEDISTTSEGLETLQSKAALSVPDLPRNMTITSFAGLRAHEDGDDFILGEAEDAPGFFNALGIESPGLTSAPAIGEYLAGMVAEKLGAEKKEDFAGQRKGILNPQELTVEERNTLIRSNPAYGSIVCRCEMVTEGEIVDAIRRPVGARSLDGVKRRTRAGMGRCQAGFCTPRTIEILQRELGEPDLAVRKNRAGSELLTGKDKEELKEAGR
ncbi:NAD(P)/FAD-dependent oxidoreductase [Cuneatibacter caecimuris]|uniref:Glycerol-3-phosphate dehydrogenase n=1 Tax=Cuneatibacter caecimuris TaxID=1796618 RepID=A0A4Q7PPK2_9FIRM|nr:NAD(P)/FAD-dependent oxidoreductase [Cuneatibacter caecimuris]RZT02425.1 glycerol-3-phosphate dehydrogenase [Cuneatibacter caecimuris]